MDRKWKQTHTWIERTNQWKIGRYSEPKITKTLEHVRTVCFGTNMCMPSTYGQNLCVYIYILYLIGNTYASMQPYPHTSVSISKTILIHASPMHHPCIIHPSFLPSMHACIHTCIHTDMDTCTHARYNTIPDLHTCILTCFCIQWYMHACIHMQIYHMKWSIQHMLYISHLTCPSASVLAFWFWIQWFYLWFGWASSMATIPWRPQNRHDWKKNMSKECGLRWKKLRFKLKSESCSYQRSGAMQSYSGQRHWFTFWIHSWIHILDSHFGLQRFWILVAKQSGVLQSGGKSGGTWTQVSDLTSAKGWERLAVTKTPEIKANPI